jgi:hypothetical protein
MSSLGCSVTVGPAEPKNKPSATVPYPPSTSKRSKADHIGLRTLNGYGMSSTHAQYHPHHQYAQAGNNEMMHRFFQHYAGPNSVSPKGPYSNTQHSYWAGAHDDGMALWQQQHHYR